MSRMASRHWMAKRIAVLTEYRFTSNGLRRRNESKFGPTSCMAK